MKAGAPAARQREETRGGDARKSREPRPALGMRRGALWLAFLAPVFGPAGERPQGLAFAVPNDPSAAHQEADLRRAVAWGLNWLVEKQRPDGSWANPQHPAMTATALLAFLRGEHEARPEVLRRGTAFVLSCVQPDGGIYRQGFLSGGRSTYNTAVCVRMLAELKDPALAPVLLRARSFLSKAQCRNKEAPSKGGFSPSPFSLYPTADVRDTVAVLEALQATESVEVVRSEGEPLAWIDRQAAASFLWSVALRRQQEAVSAGSAMSCRGRQWLWAHLWLGLCLAARCGDVPGMDLFRERMLERVSAPPRDASLETLWMATQALACETRSSGPCSDPTVRRAWHQCMADRLLAARQDDPSRAQTSWTEEHRQRLWEMDPTLATAYAILMLQSFLSSWDGEPLPPRKDRSPRPE